MTDTPADWHRLEGMATAWFACASLTEAAVLAGRVVELAPEAAVDLRRNGVRVRLDDARVASAVSGVARELGLVAHPTVLQQVGVVVETPDPAALQPFWRGVLGYVDASEGELADPLRRDPTLRFCRSDDRRPLRQRLHLDVVRPASVVEQVRPGEPTGPYEACHADVDGNEVDLVPGDRLGDGEGTADWQVVFGAMACYRVGSRQQQLELASAAAGLADEVDFPLLVDLRPGLVVLDSGKDRWEKDAHGLSLDFVDLARLLQRQARALGAVADPGLPRLVQLFLDAADVDAVKAFWLAALGYEVDRRPWTSDIHDPHRLGPTLVFQQLDASDTERRRQRNRTHVELTVPEDAAAARVAAAVDAGGRVLDGADARWHVADPEGNEVVVVSSP